MQPSPTHAPYVIVTPAHNEEAHIERTIISVIGQTVRPRTWIVVSDNSSDRTSAIVAVHARRHPFIRLVELKRSGERHFGNKVRAFNAGVAQLNVPDYGFIGNLDADISLESDYFEKVLAAFAADATLGIAGGMVSSRIGDRFVSQNVAHDSVAGAVQLFRRECFEAIGGYVPLPLGGIDSAAEIMARMKGWRVRTLPELMVLEHRRTGTACAPPIVSKFREGRRLRSLGYDFGFLLLRCFYRSLDAPVLLGSMATLAGYARSALSRDPLVLSPEVVRYLRSEQRRKFANSLRSLHVRHLRGL